MAEPVAVASFCGVGALGNRLPRILNVNNGEFRLARLCANTRAPHQD
jgi:hypothetical protein